MTRKPQRTTSKTSSGPDEELGGADILPRNEQRLTRKLVQGLVNTARTVGRPSMSAPGKHSPSVTVRLPEDLNNRLIEEATRTGKRRSDIIREALVQRLAN